jgi:hypothetical protein
MSGLLQFLFLPGVVHGGLKVLESVKSGQESVQEVKKKKKCALARV